MGVGIAKLLCTQLDTCKCTQMDTSKPTKCLIARGGINANDQPLTWHSVEHNLDAYSALAYFGYLTHDISYTKVAKQIRRCLETCAWDVTQGRFLRGLDDPVATMDVNPWGILALGDTAWLGYDFTVGLNWSLENCRTIHDWEGHWDPYPHLIGDVDGFDFNDDKDVVWVEGTESMALALHLAEQDSLANYFHAEMTKLIPAANDGGLPYATNEGTIAADDDELSATYPSVAGTAWYIFKELNYNPFEIPPEAHPDPDGRPCPIEAVDNIVELNDYRIYANYPNPFNPDTKITFNLPRTTHTLLQIFNSNGQMVKTLINAELAPGLHNITWNGRDQQGQRMSSGLYFYLLKTEFGNLTRKMLLLK